MPDLDRLVDVERAPALDAGLPLLHRPQIDPGRLEVSARRDALQMVVGLVGAGGEVLSPPQLRVRVDGNRGHADRAEAAGVGAQGRADLFGMGRAGQDALDRRHHLGLVELVIAAHEEEGGSVVDDVDERLDLVRGRHAEEGRDVGDRLLPGSVDLARLARRRLVFDLLEARDRPLEIRRVAAAALHDEILARLHPHHEFLGLTPSHGAGAGLDRDELQAAAGVDPAIDLVVELVAAIEPREIDVERVGVFHGELPDPQQSRLRARLVPELRLDLVPDLRQVLVGTDLLARDVGEDLLVRHPQAEVASGAVLEPEHGLTHVGPASTFLPQVGRVQRRQMELLRPGAVELLADDPGNLEHRALAEREHRVDAGRELADEAAADEEPVRRELGVRRVVAQRGDECLGPAHMRQTPPVGRNARPVLLGVAEVLHRGVDGRVSRHDGIEPGHLHQVRNVGLQRSQAQLSAGFPHLRVAHDQDPDSVAVDVVELREVEDDLPRLVADETVHGQLHVLALASQRDPAVDVEEHDVGFDLLLLDLGHDGSPRGRQ